MIQPYVLTLRDLHAITDEEVVLGTQRLLPPENTIPPEFFLGNTCTQIAGAMLAGKNMPAGFVSFKSGFPDDENTAKALQRCLTAHLKSREVSFEHKIAGVGLMISQVCEFRPLTDARISPAP